MAINLTNIAAVDAMRSVKSTGAPREATEITLPGTRQIAPGGGNDLPGAAAQAAPVDRAALSAAVSRLNSHVQNISRDLEFTVDEELDRVIIKVYDSETEEVIRQIPPEEVLSLARHLADLEGVILKTKA